MWQLYRAQGEKNEYAVKYHYDSQIYVHTRIFSHSIFIYSLIGESTHNKEDDDE